MKRFLFALVAIALSFALLPSAGAAGKLHVMVSNTTPAPGETVSIDYTGCVAGDPVTLSPAPLTASGTADAAGAGVLQVTAPSTPGMYVGYVNCSTGNLEVTLDVLPAANGAIGQPLFQSAACIESALVQSTPVAASMGVGNRFRADGMTYVITTGGPSCHFNCHMGFDINCDGRLGDYCPANLNLTRVKDVGICLDLLAAAPAPPAVPAAAPAPAVEPPTVLAHTGASGGLLEASLVLLAAGGAASALAVRRRRSL